MFILPLMSKAKGARAYVTEWTSEDDALLLNLWETKTAAEIVPYFPGRTKRAIECRLCWMRKHLGVNPKGKSVHFNQEDDRFIRRNCAEKSIAWIAHQLGRTENAIMARGYRLGVSFRKFGSAYHSTKYSDEDVRMVRALRDSEGRKLTFREIGEKLEISKKAAENLYHRRMTADDRYWQDMLPK